MFQNLEYADLYGIGGDLSAQSLLRAYAMGLFPWYSKPSAILWWCPRERFVLRPQDIHVSHSMQRILRKHLFEITYDTAFREVIRQCRETRSLESAWIHDEILHAYTHLHELGYAHSVEAWHNNRLVGGLYGVSLGKCFYGESMFSCMSNASKVAFINLCSQLQAQAFHIIDCQVYSRHLQSLGARHIARESFLQLLQKALQHKTLRGDWNKILFFSQTQEI